MNETHIKVGDMWHFKWLVNTITQNKVSKFPPEVVSSFFGLPLIEDTRIPKNRACLTDKYGNVLQIFDLPDFAENKEN